MCGEECLESVQGCDDVERGDVGENHCFACFAALLRRWNQYPMPQRRSRQPMDEAVAIPIVAPREGSSFPVLLLSA